MQALAGDDAEMQRLKWVTAVSGGSYISAARTLQAHRTAHAGYGAAEYRTLYQQAYALGSPEERRLREHTHYLVPDATQGLRGVLSLLWGAIGNLLLISSLFYGVASLVGWLLRAMGSLTWVGPAHALVPRLTVTNWQIWILAGLGIAFALTFVASRLPWRKLSANTRLTSWTAKLFGLAAVASLLLVAAPELFCAVWPTPSTAGSLSAQTGPKDTFIAVSLFATGTVAFARATIGAISASWSRVGKSMQAVVRPWLVRAGRTAMPWIGSALVALGLLSGTVFVLGTSGAPVVPRWYVAAAFGLFAVLHVAMDVNKSSLHAFYRDRLASAYAAPGDPTLMSELTTAVPELIVCAAANLQTGEVRENYTPGVQDRGPVGIPPGRHAASWTFTPTRTELHLARPDGNGENAEWASTSTYEVLVGRDRMAVFDLVAISGAAVSPLMGKLTVAARRLLFVAVNLRLGMWLPRPSSVAELEDGQQHEAGSTGWWRARKLAAWKQVRRDRDADPPSRWRLFRAALLWRLFQPNLLLLWREAAGRNRVGGEWIYVSDGAGFDNLGLVEALRKHPQRVYVLDAGGDQAHVYHALGRAIALARTELGAEIDIEPRVMELTTVAGPDDKATGTEPPARKAEVRQPFAVGSCRYANGSVCEINVIKLGVWEGHDLPWDVRAYHEAHPTFPHDSTLQQLYDDEDFEAYRELGEASMRALLTHKKRTASRHTWWQFRTRKSTV